VARHVELHGEAARLGQELVVETDVADLDPLHLRFRCTDRGRNDRDEQQPGACQSEDTTHGFPPARP
jgi:hypothetical protein